MPGTERKVKELKNVTILSQRLRGRARTKTTPIKMKTAPTDIAEIKLSPILRVRFCTFTFNLFRLSPTRLFAVSAHITFPFYAARGVYFKYLFINTRIEKGERMSYCPKCGNKVEENMTFCPRCGAPLKAEAPGQAAPAPVPQRGEKAEKGEKQEKHEKQEPEKGEKHEKGEYGFIGWLIGGVILILIGFFALLQISNIITSVMGLAFVLLIVGILIIIAAVYFTSMARRRYPPPS